ncbi:Mitochondrial inner membrane i-AAA protease supercomplex subunit YME1 [Yarrowia sp. B02]|nr:Mitochondrial inner membrane i-AAA protease supercomplex subunit YME1 [Yarrowia sp. B02]
MNSLFAGLRSVARSQGLLPRALLRAHTLKSQKTQIRAFNWSSLKPGFLAETVPTHVLAAKEQAANRNLSNPDAQQDFYKALINTNYPHVVTQRYESPGVARNHECDKLYVAALKSQGQHDKAENMEHRLLGGSAGAGQKGTRADPVHVILKETTASAVTKWIRFILPLALIGYMVWQSVELLSESSLVKGTSGFNSKLSDPTDGSKSTVKFSDVHGVDEARGELEEIVDFLKDPSKFTGLGGKLPKGVLLTGPPGTGKTLLARAVAGEADVPFYFVSGSEFDEMYVGVGAKRVRELFEKARAKAPAIIFIDELDAIGGKRNPKDHAYSKQTLNQLLIELDGFSPSTGIVIIAATNFPQMLDKALTRPGRFDKMVNVELPDVRGRIAILKHHMKKVESSPLVDCSVLARGTSGFSGAELMNLVNQAAIQASKEKALSVDMSHFEWAKDKILMGAARSKMVLTEESIRNTAYHEAGHALMALYSPAATPIYKATILPRGQALGLVQQLPELDKYDMTKQEMFARVDVCMGGKIAEELINGAENVTGGCSSDLRQATSMAKHMVTTYGMSDAVGPMSFGDDQWSQHLQQLAEGEIQKILFNSEKRSRKLLTEKLPELHRLAQSLLDYETLTAEEIKQVVKGEKLPREKGLSVTVVKSKDIRDNRGGKKKDDDDDAEDRSYDDGVRIGGATTSAKST